MALYGKNASGKTTILDALYALTMKTTELNAIARQLIIEGRHDGLTKRQIKAERKAYVASQPNKNRIGTPQWHSVHNLMMASRYRDVAVRGLGLALGDAMARKLRVMHLNWYIKDKARYRRQLGSIKNSRLASKKYTNYPLWCEIGSDVPFTRKDGD